MTEYSPASPIFKITHDAKKIWRIINTIPSIWGENILGYLSLDIICSSKLTVALRKLFASRNRLCLRTNILAYFRTKWKLLFIYSLLDMGIFMYFQLHIMIIITVPDMSNCLSLWEGRLVWSHVLVQTDDLIGWEIWLLMTKIHLRFKQKKNNVVVVIISSRLSTRHIS